MTDAEQVSMFLPLGMVIEAAVAQFNPKQKHQVIFLMGSPAENGSPSECYITLSLHNHVPDFILEGIDIDAIDKLLDTGWQGGNKN